MIDDNDCRFEDERNYISYSSDKDESSAIFVRRCPICSRFVKADDKIRFNCDGVKREPNATCKKCGRVEMPFQGFF